MRQHVVELGEGAGVVNAPAIVLLHGAGCNLEDMRLALGERLAARDRVILLDRPGLGWSERKGGDGSSPTYQAVIPAHRAGPVAFVSSRWGGRLCARWTIGRPPRLLPHGARWYGLIPPQRQTPAT